MSDTDSRVRYYACESLYNVTKGNFVALFLCVNSPVNSFKIKSISVTYYSSFPWFLIRISTFSVARENILPLFNDVFSAMSIAITDADQNVRTATELLVKLSMVGKLI